MSVNNGYVNKLQTLYDQLDHLLFYKQQIASNLFNSFTQAIKTRAAVRLEFLIAINVAIKKINLS